MRRAGGNDFVRSGQHTFVQRFHQGRITPFARGKQIRQQPEIAHVGPIPRDLETLVAPARARLEVMQEIRFTRRRPQFRRRPEPVVRIVTLIRAGGETRQIGGLILRMRDEKRITLTRRRETAVRVRGVELAQMSRARREHRNETRRSGTAPRREIAFLNFLFRHDEAAEVGGAHLVIHGTVRRLHGEQPVELPFDLGEKLGQRSATFRQIQRLPLNRRPKVLPRAEHAADRHPGVADVFIVIARVVPAAGGIFAHAFFADVIEPRVVRVTKALSESFPLMRARNRRTAAPQVHGARHRDKRLTINVRADAERRRTIRTRHDEMKCSGIREGRKIRREQSFARVPIGARAGECARKNHVPVGANQREVSGRGRDAGLLGLVRQKAEAVQAHRGCSNAGPCGEAENEEQDRNVPART